MKTIFTISRLFAGFVFIFSGFVKAIDPTGYAIKIEEYFIAFHVDFLNSITLPLAILLSAAELMIGLNLLVRTRMKFTIWLLTLFMTYFTILTFILALANPVSDCGCFGDAVKLTNWQTFWKNIIIDVPTLVLFINRDKPVRLSACRIEWTLSVLNLALPVLLSVYCLRHEPVLDFRPYKIGTYIPDEMIVPEGVPLDEYETILIYEKDGVQKEFSETNYPWQDTAWKWIETRQNLISKGYEPPIHDFSITNSEGTDITNQILTDDGFVLLIIAPKLEHASLRGMAKMNDMALKAQELGMDVYGLTASPTSEIDKFMNAVNPSFDICIVDETTLETIMRSNPGLMILREGTIWEKCSFRDIPAANNWLTNLSGYLLKKQHTHIEIITACILALSVILLYCLMLYGISRYATYKNKVN
jgi:hypothetical protein